MRTKNVSCYLLCCLLLLLLPACSRNNAAPNNTAKAQSKNPSAHNLSMNQVRQAQIRSTDTQKKAMLINKYSGKVPKQWSENATGVLHSLDTREKVIALTFDANGTPNGNGYDAELIDYLHTRHIPATLFVSNRWIDANHLTFMALAHNHNFEIENNGFGHRPLSVNGRSAQNIVGTQNVADIEDEVLGIARRIETMTGDRVRFFRAGTPTYDELAVRVVKDLGYNVVNFNVNGDGGATFTATQVKNALLNAPPGAIVHCHMDHPESNTYEGIRAALPELTKRGFRFVKLNNFPLK